MRARRLTLALPIAVLLGSACQAGDEEPSEPGPASSAQATGPRVVEVTAVDYAFAGPDEVAPGWTTFELENRGAEPHFLLLTRLPEGRDLDDYGREVGLVFGAVWDELRSGAIGKAEAGALLGQNLPAWYADAVFMGGPGLVGAGRTARTTVLLEPGTYVMECYVKTPDGAFHSALGMLRELTVTVEPTTAGPPEADLEVTVSNAGIDGPASLEAGRHTIAVRFVEHPELGLGNDVHVARLGPETTPEDVAGWMDWMDVGGLEAPAPAEFLGGAEEMPPGRTAYFTVDLEAGRYALVSERPADEGKVRELTVE